MIQPIIEPLNRSKPVALAAAERLHRMIVSGELAPGTRLPSITTLARRFGIAVAGMREALAALDAAGLVEVRHGSGTFVRWQPPDEQLLSGWLGFGSSREELHGLIEARRVIEVELAGLAAKRASREERRRSRRQSPR